MTDQAVPSPSLEPRTDAGKHWVADKHWAVHGPMRGCVYPCTVGIAIAAIEAEATAPLLAALREISESYDEWSRRPHHQADPMIPERLWRALVAGAALVPAEPPEAP